MNDAGTSVKTASGLNVLAGLWLAVSPWALGFAGGLGDTAASGSAWNALVVGLVVAMLAGARIAGAGTWASWTNVVLGFWMVIAPFLFDTAGNSTILWNAIITGVVIAGLAAWSATAGAREADARRTRI